MLIVCENRLMIDNARTGLQLPVSGPLEHNLTIGDQTSTPITNDDPPADDIYLSTNQKRLPKLLLESSPRSAMLTPAQCKNK